MASTRILTGVAALAFLLGAVYFTLLPAMRFEAARTACSIEKQKDKASQIDCWYKLFEQDVADGGVPQAFDTLSKLYKAEPAFAETGCHRHAHKIGDLAYYELYLPDPDLKALNIPASSSACDFGFFHGLLEHLVQNDPDPAFAASVCAELADTLSGTMGNLAPTCHHGIAHGFMAAQVERITEGQKGNTAAHVEQPLEQCKRLPDGEYTDDCAEGVFNIWVDWSVWGEHGFSYDAPRMFAFCASLENAWQEPCVREVAAKLAKPAGFQLTGIREITNTIRDPELRDSAFFMGVMVMVQHVTGSDGESALFDECIAFSQNKNECSDHIVGGLFNFGEPQKEYVRAIRFCNALSEEDTLQCFDGIGRQLRRFYPRDTIERICTEFPTVFQPKCLRV